jgi:cytidine deaminase
MDLNELYQTARNAAAASYSPYSKFRVGAALLCDDGTVVTGANIENRSFGLTICAERSAIVTAASSGRRGYRALAICTPDAEYPVSPCGACRQVISEFASPEMPVVFGNGESIGVRTSVKELLPYDALHELSGK